MRLATKLPGYELDIEADKSHLSADTESPEVSAPVAAAPVAEVPEAPKPRQQGPTPVVGPKPKLKKKSDLENSLLDAIESHGEDSTEQ